MTDEPYRITSVRQHTLTIDGNGDPITVSIDRETPAPSEDINAGSGDEPNAIKSGRVIVQNEYQVLDGEVAESGRCVTDDTYTHPMPRARENIDAH